MSAFGKAYDQGGCASYNVLYINLKPVKNPASEEGYSDIVDTIRLQGGYNLTAYAEEIFQGRLKRMFFR